MENNVFKVVLLLALPASGKSEVRNFMANIEPERLQKEFHIGENLQLDDFPYVHFMRCIDNEMERIGQPRVFYPSDAEPFFNDYDWGTLVQLLNEDYHDLMNRQKIEADSLSRWLFARIDAAALKCGISPRMALISEDHVVVPETHNGLPVNEIRGNVFQNLGFTTIDLPSGLTVIRASTFENCGNLVSIDIPDGVTRIAAHAFCDCSSLREATIPPTVNEIGSSAFRRCSSLRTVRISRNADVNSKAFKESPTQITYY